VHRSLQNYIDDIRVNCRNSFVLEIKPTGYFNGEERLEDKGLKIQRILRRDLPYGLSSSLESDKNMEKELLLDF